MLVSYYCNMYSKHRHGESIRKITVSIALVTIAIGALKFYIGFRLSSSGIRLLMKSVANVTVVVN